MGSYRETQSIHNKACAKEEKQTLKIKRLHLMDEHRIPE
jgi:hypothetical protein